MLDYCWTAHGTFSILPLILRPTWPPAGTHQWVPTHSLKTPALNQCCGKWSHCYGSIQQIEPSRPANKNSSAEHESGESVRAAQWSNQMAVLLRRLAADSMIWYCSTDALHISCSLRDLTKSMRIWEFYLWKCFFSMLHYRHSIWLPSRLITGLSLVCVYSDFHTSGTAVGKWHLDGPKLLANHCRYYGAVVMQTVSLWKGGPAGGDTVWMSQGGVGRVKASAWQWTKCSSQFHGQ